MQEEKEVVNEEAKTAEQSKDGTGCCQGRKKGCEGSGKGR